MKIGMVAPHAFPVPYANHSGDICIVDLSRSLDELGHEVTFFAPDGSYIPPHGKQLTMPCSYGKIPPTGESCERECFNNYVDILQQQDIVHDWSNTKYIADSLYNIGYTNVLSTIAGGAWPKPTPPHNLVALSHAQRDRVIRGVSDFENTFIPNIDGAPKYPVKDTHVVYHGTDTDFYTPTYNKKSYFLWLNRWGQARGQRTAIEIARATGIELVVAGEHPNDVMFEDHRKWALDAVDLAKDLPNVRFEWLPKDPDHHIAKRELYRNARAFLNVVQLQEPFGLTQIEALSCGTPVIGARFGSIPEIIEDGITGYVSNNDMDSFAKAIAKIDSIKPETCRDHAVKRFSGEAMAKAYLHEYNLVIGGSKW